VSWMKAAALLGLALLLMLLPAVALSEAQPQPTAAFSAEAEHVMTLYNGGAVFVNDTIELRNTGGAALTYIKVGLPENLSRGIDVEEAYGPQGERLRIEHEGLGTPGLYGLKVLLPQPLAPGESVTLTLRLFFSDLLSYSSPGYTVSLYTYPALEANISRLNATVLLPSGVTPTTYPPGFNATTSPNGTVLSQEALNVESYSSPIIKVAVQGDLQVLDVISMRRSIFLSGEADISLREDYLLRNPTSKTLSAVRLFLPRDAYAAEAEDPLGPLQSEFQAGSPGGRGSVTVTLRNDLSKDEQASVSVSYHLQAKTYLQAKAFGTDYTLQLDAPLGINATVREFSAMAMLPEGAELTAVSGGDGSWNRTQDLFTQSISWPSRHVTPLDALGFSLTYRYSPLWAALRPSLLGGTLAAVGLAVFLSRRRITPVTVAPTLPLSLIRSVADALEQRLRLRREAERLALELGEGRLSRGAYRERMGAISRRRTVIEKTLAEQAPQLRQAGERYAQILQRIEETEAEIEAGEAGIEGLTRRYRARAMSREVYERMLSDHQRRVERAKATIERLIQSLRSEIRAAS